MASLYEKLKKRREAQEKVGRETASEASIKESQEAAKAFESDVKKKKKDKGQSDNSKDGWGGVRVLRN